MDQASIQAITSTKLPAWRSQGKTKARLRTKLRQLMCAACCLDGQPPMDWFFYIPAVVATVATVMVITRLNAVHALLYLIVSLLSVAMVFFRLGAPFIAALEVIIYAGAIMVLFVFVIMMLNLGPRSTERESNWLRPRMWVGPITLTIILLIELIYILG